MSRRPRRKIDLTALKKDEKKWRLADQLENVEVRNRVLTLIRGGATAEETARVLSEGDPARGVKPHPMTTQAVTLMVKRYLDRIHTEDALTIEQMRVLENERLDQLWRSMATQMRNPDGTVNLRIVDRMTRLSERRSKMNGIEAAQRHEHYIGNALESLGLEKEHLERADRAWLESGPVPAELEVVEAEVVDAD